MVARVCFDARDIDHMVLTQSQAEILRGIYQAAVVLNKELSPELHFYWHDRLKAYQLALDIALWYGAELIMHSEILALKTQNALLTQKLYDRVASKVTVRGGLKL